MLKKASVVDATGTFFAGFLFLLAKMRAYELLQASEFILIKVEANASLMNENNLIAFYPDVIFADNCVHATDLSYSINPGINDSGLLRMSIRNRLTSSHIG
jgi:hypothetical protein